MTTREQLLRTRAQDAGQAHLFEHFEALDPKARERFLDEVERVDFELVRHFATLLAIREPEQRGEIRPPDVFALRSLRARARGARAERRAGRTVDRRALSARGGGASLRARGVARYAQGADRRRLIESTR